ncbi:hypothetical protein O181_078342 [Austropuccinia psidii MF-1]|uniref:Reverse transcriptase Ty1/copia-type domain-containing protein n=1 Tax=Austropuccinia psidii MF-1 TaxID=1389203 RepID=A0A9Q3FHN2_9BASI|nr:hypothetical protein [Austropuccinia psidii MF-1]
MDTVPEKAPRDITSKIDSSNIINEKRQRFAKAAALFNTNTPKTYLEAISSSFSEDWKRAIDDKIASIEENQVWLPVPIPNGANLLGSTWVFRLKENESGTIIRHKARLCVQGFSQIEGVYYNDTYTPTERLASLRFLLSYCANYNHELQQMDVRTTFLHGVTKEDVFMKYPQGYPHKKEPGTCLKLVKCLYRLKQSPRCWYQKLSEVFSSFDFKPCWANPCLFINKASSFCAIYVHVDDMLIGGVKEAVESFKINIKEIFKMDDIGDVSYLLGIKIRRNRRNGTILLSQKLYIDKILKEFGMENCKSVSTPMDPNFKLVPSTDSNQDLSFSFRKAVGLLSYLTSCSRPDLTYDTSILSQFLEQPSVIHVAAFKRVLCYLQGTRSLELSLGGFQDSLNILGYSNSDWGNNFDGCSFSGYGILCGGLVMWKSKKQPSVALSSTEAELRSMTKCAQDILWVRKLLSDFGISLNSHLCCDN